MVDWMKSLLDNLLGRRRSANWLDALGSGLGRANIERLVSAPAFDRLIIALIILNAATLGLETSPSFMARYGEIAGALDFAILLVFTIEVALRIYAYRLGFFRTAWGWFDLIVVVVSYLPSLSGLSALRVFRVFRLFRLISMVPKMRRVIDGFFAALPGMGGVVAVLGLIFYVSAVITTQIFGQADFSTLPEGVTEEDVAVMRELYGTMGASFFTLFQLMTLEDWAGGIVLPTMKVFPNALLFFIPYIVVTAFAVLNLFIGIIVDGMQDDREQQVEEEAAERKQEAERLRRQDIAREDRRFEEVLEELRAVKLELAALNKTQGGDRASRR